MGGGRTSGRSSLSTVGPHEPGVLDHTPAAIATATSGDQICVEPGTYNEPVQLVAKQVSVHGYGPEETVIDGTGLTHPVYLYGINSGISVAGLTVMNGDKSYGAGLYVESSSATIRDVVFRDNVSTAGATESCSGAIGYVGGSGAPVLQNVVFRDNSMTCGYGWGLLELNGPSVTMENVALVDNLIDSSVRSYGVVTMYGSGTLNADNVIVANNSVVARTDIVYGMAFSSFPGWTVNLTNVVVAENTGSGSACYGAVYAEGALDITNSSITGNTCANAGAVYTVNGEPTLTYTNVFGNSSPAFNFTDPTGVDGNIDSAPRFNDTSSDLAAEWDFTLKSTSDLIDAGDPTITDPDGSTSDIGAHGGPLGESW